MNGEKLSIVPVNAIIADIGKAASVYNISAIDLGLVINEIFDQFTCNLLTVEEFKSYDNYQIIGYLESLEERLLDLLTMEKSDMSEDIRSFVCKLVWSIIYEEGRRVDIIASRLISLCDVCPEGVVTRVKVNTRNMYIFSQTS